MLMIPWVFQKCSVKIYHHIHKNRDFFHIPSQFNPVYIFALYFITVYFNIMLPVVELYFRH
jgi:hypothetical protein